MSNQQPLQISGFWRPDTEITRVQLFLLHAKLLKLTLLHKGKGNLGTCSGELPVQVPVRLMSLVADLIQTKSAVSQLGFIDE